MNLGLGLGAGLTAPSVRFPVPNSARQIGLYRTSSDSYSVWRHLGRQFWSQHVVSRDSSGVPLNWRETILRQVYCYRAAQESGIIYTGGWATDNANSAVGSAALNTYIGGRARQAIAAGDYAEITFTGGGDIFVIYVGRTSGNYVNVLLDGAQTYLTLEEDGAGNKFFDSYSASDLAYKTKVLVASGVPEGEHTLRLTVSATKNASSSGNRFMFNAVAWNGDSTGPWLDEATSPEWQSGESVYANQERKYGANYYYATSTGTTGATPPTHTSGTVSDGSVSWTYRASSYSLVSSQIQATGSQLEYAYRFKPTGATAFEDVGGSLHGNEAQASQTITVDGVDPTLSDGEWAQGDGVVIAEVIEATHSETGATVIVDTSLTRTFRVPYVTVEHNHTFNVACEVGWFYGAMWPLLHYHGGTGQKYALDRLYSLSEGVTRCADYYGNSDAETPGAADYAIFGWGRCFQPDGVGGVPTSQSAPNGFALWCEVTPETVGYHQGMSATRTNKDMNTSGADVSAGGASSMVSKMYFSRFGADNPQAVGAATTLNCSARYGLIIE